MLEIALFDKQMRNMRSNSQEVCNFDNLSIISFFRNSSCFLVNFQSSFYLGLDRDTTIISFFFKLHGIKIFQGKGSSRFKKATKLKRDTYLIIRLLSQSTIFQVRVVVSHCCFASNCAVVPNFRES